MKTKHGCKPIPYFDGGIKNFLNLSQAIDVGALTPSLWGFDHQDLPAGLENDIAKFCSFPKIINDLENLLTDNRIFKQRNVDCNQR